MTDLNESALEAAHRKAVEAATASAKASSGQPYDGHLPPAYEVYRDTLLSALVEDEVTVERVAEAVKNTIVLNAAEDGIDLENDCIFQTSKKNARFHLRMARAALSALVNKDTQT